MKLSFVPQNLFRLKIILLLFDFFSISLSTQTKISDKDEDGESRGVECVGGGEAVEGDEADSVDKAAAEEAPGNGPQGSLLQVKDSVCFVLFLDAIADLFPHPVPLSLGHIYCCKSNHQTF